MTQREAAASMQIKSIRIKQLFEIFDYDIPLQNEDGIVIITGPNGFGKTMVLNVIFNLFNSNFEFFDKLVFHQIDIVMEEEIDIKILKAIDEEASSPRFIFSRGGKTIEEFSPREAFDEQLILNFEHYLPVTRVASDEWLDLRTERKVTYNQLVREYRKYLPRNVARNAGARPKEKEVYDILDSLKVHLIREQRLFQKANLPKDGSYRDPDQTLMTETIQNYAGELKQLISEVSKRSFTQTQELDSSYPKRLRTETDILTEDEYTSRYETLKEKQAKLTEFGLYESKQEFLTFDQEDAKALSVYIKDLDKKLSVFDELLQKLELFTDILNQRRFTFKSIQITRDKGFYFRTSRGKELELSELSSGEQHEVVLLYELIFNVRQSILVLIDEPEISLHIAWQKEFLNDLLKIIAIQKIQVLIATHSPSIINDRWDLVYNLEQTAPA